MRQGTHSIICRQHLYKGLNVKQSQSCLKRKLPLSCTNFEVSLKTHYAFTMLCAPLETGARSASTSARVITFGPDYDKFNPGRDGGEKND